MVFNTGQGKETGSQMTRTYITLFAGRNDNTNNVMVQILFRLFAEYFL